MHCPVCSNKDTKVVDSRVAQDGANIRRRRECDKCGFRFSTLEEIELLDLVVVKRDGRRETYSRDKLERGLQKALEKRPYTETQFQQIVHKLERDIQKKRRGELTSREIGELVMKHLRSFDTVAYIRFASVYRSFADAKTFENELHALLAGKPVRKTPKSQPKR
jgi:transcriptional repressor NrdR